MQLADLSRYHLPVNGLVKESAMRIVLALVVIALIFMVGVAIGRRKGP